MADSDPTAFFRPKWHQAYWQRHRLFQAGTPPVSSYTGFKRRQLPSGLFAGPPDMPHRRRFAPLAGTAFWGHVSLLWGV